MDYDDVYVLMEELSFNIDTSYSITDTTWDEFDIKEFLKEHSL